MLNSRKYVPIAMALVALGAGTAAADPVEDVFAAVDGTVATTARTIDGNIVVVWPTIHGVTDPIVTGIPEEETFDHNTDYIVITDTGGGPIVSKHGVFGNPYWWTCTTSYGGGAPVTVTCDATSQHITGKYWRCGVMDVTANALSTHRQIYPWVRDEVDQARASAQGILSGRISAAPRRPDPGKIAWGQAAGRLACEGTQLETETATSAAPFQTSTAAFNVTQIMRFTCEARLAKGAASAPVAPYSVNCLDPRGTD